MSALVKAVFALAALLPSLILAPALARAANRSHPPVPVLSRTVVASTVSGRVTVEPKGAHSFSELVTPRAIAVGSTLDTTRGEVRLVTAASTRGMTQFGVFGGGAFAVTQSHSGLTTLRLTGGRSAAACGVTHAALASSSGAANRATVALSTRVLRSLNARAHGRFRTSGRYAAATARGTAWKTTDGCDGTSILDRTDRVATQSNNARLSFALAPGQAIVYHCAARGQRPVSSGYCTAVLTSLTTIVSNGRRVSEFAFSTGLSTKSNDDQAELCVTGPQRTVCTVYPMTAPDRFGFRTALVGCVPTQGAGRYAVTWKVRGVDLGAPLAFRSPVGAAFQPCLSWLGKPTVGSRVALLGAGVKEVSRYTLPTAGHARDIRIFLLPAASAGQQVMKGVVYADSGGAPGALLATTDELTYQASEGAGWYALTFPRNPTPADPSGLVQLAAGSYWIGVIAGDRTGVAAVPYDAVAGGALAYNPNPYGAGPSDPFGPITTAAEQQSLYMAYFAPPF